MAVSFTFIRYMLGVLLSEGLIERSEVSVSGARREMGGFCGLSFLYLLATRAG